MQNVGLLNQFIIEQNYHVFVRCNTFNQSVYIKDTLEGFVIQKTNFPYVCMVMDDCSTDGEQQLLIDWMTQECNMENATEFDMPDSRVIIVPHKKNESCTFAFYLLKRNTWKEREIKLAMYKPWRECCEYEALCEGDDYWTDPLKLQKQVDLLENHPEYIMSVHACDWESQETMIPCPNGIRNSRALTTDEMIRHGGLYVNTLSTVYRINAFPKDRPSWWKKADVGDYPLHIAGTLYGTCYYFTETMGVYRFQSSGSWTNTNKSMNLNHVKCEIDWLTLLDAETEGKYTAAIHHHLLPYYQFVYNQREINIISYWHCCIKSKELVSFIRFGKDLLIHTFPRLYKLIGHYFTKKK